MNSSPELLRWDSHHFGQTIARWTVERLDDAGMRRALNWCQRKHVDCLYVLCRSLDRRSVLVAETYGLGYRDTRVTLHANLAQGIASRSLTKIGGPRISYRMATPRDETRLRALTAQGFLHSRFAVDPKFSSAAAARFFQEWASRSIVGAFDDCVWIAEAGHRIAGLISCRRISASVGSVGLVKIAEEFQGRGIGSLLLQHALNWFRQQRLPHVRVITQAANVSALQFYQKSGFEIASVQTWYHKWFNGSVHDL